MGACFTADPLLKLTVSVARLRLFRLGPGYKQDTDSSGDQQGAPANASTKGCWQDWGDDHGGEDAQQAERE